MKKIASTLAAAALLAASTVMVSSPAQASTGKVTICHATGSGKYVTQTVAKDGAAGGHAGHQNGADIIPAFSWVEEGVRRYFDGQNLDKVALIENGCKEAPTSTAAQPNPPIYTPASCARPEFPYGQVTLPAELGNGVASATDPALNPDNTQWSTQYTLAADTEDTDWSWPTDQTGLFTFPVVPITADPLWVTDSKTGAGACEMPETGAEMWMIPAGAAGAALILGGGLMARRRTA